MTHRDQLRVDKALQGADFPSTRESLLTYAEDRGSDAKTMAALRTIPTQRYENTQQVLDAVAHEPEGEEEPGGTARGPS